MTPGLSKDIQHLERHYPALGSKIIIRQSTHAQWAVNLVIAAGHFNLHTGISVGMYGLTYTLINPKDTINYNDNFLEFEAEVDK